MGRRRPSETTEYSSYVVVQIYGLSQDDVFDAVQAVNNIIDNCESSELITQKLPELSYKKAHWEYLHEGHYEPYPAEIDSVIESAFKENKSFVEFEENDTEYTRIVFPLMVERKVGSSQPTVKIRRVFRDSLPEHWIPMTPGQVCVLVEIEQNSKEYEKVQKDIKPFGRSSIKRNIDLLKVERLQNPALYTRYVEKKVEIDGRIRGMRNERRLWRGVSPEELDVVNSCGFNTNAEPHLVSEGIGFFQDFSNCVKSTKFAADLRGYKYVYQCLVLTGDFTHGAYATRTAPVKSDGGVYDSTVDDPIDPRLFVVYDDNQVYPLYLITYR